MVDFRSAVGDVLQKIKDETIEPGSVKTEKLLTDLDQQYGNVPANFSADNAPGALALWVGDDDAGAGNLGYSASIQHLTEFGERLATVSADTVHNHWKVYTKPDAVGDGDTQPKPRFQIAGGSEFARADFQNLSSLLIQNNDTESFVSPPQFRFNFEGDGGTSLSMTPEDGATSYLRFDDYESSQAFFIESSPYANRFRLFDSLGGYGSFFSFNASSGRVSLEQRPTQDVVWVSGPNRPSSPDEGQRFFDSDLGQPIWYDGSNWVDAQGNTV